MAVIDGKWLSKEGLTYFWSKIKAIFTKQTETNVIANLGAKNMLKITASSQTIQGVTFTVNADQTVTVNGTNTGAGSATFVIVPNRQAILIPDGDYWFTGCPQGGDAATFDLRWYRYSPNASAYDLGSGAAIHKSGNTTDSNIAIVVKSGVTVNNITFRPMLRRAEITDDTFVPYAPTNRELYETKTEQTETNAIANLGAKNLLKITASSGALNTATIAIADDGSIHISGQPSSNGAYVLSSGIELVISENAYILSMGAEAGNTKMSLSLRRKGTTQYVDLYHAESRIIPSGTYDRLHVYLYADTVYDTNVYPMIRRAEITDSTFEPYAPTNRELYETKAKQTETNVIANLGAKNLFRNDKNAGATVVKQGATWVFDQTSVVANVSGTVSTVWSDVFLLNSNFDLSDKEYKIVIESDSPDVFVYIPGNTLSGGNIPSNGQYYAGVYRYQGIMTTSTRFTAKTGSYSNATIRCMICPAEITDDTFQPYAKTNRELTVAEDEDRAALIGQVDGGAKNILNLNTNFTSYTSKGITYTNNGDGTINVSGTSNAWDSYITLYDVNGDTLFGIPKGETVILKSTSNNVSVNLIYKKQGGGYGLTVRGYKDSPATFTIPSDFSGYLLRIAVPNTGTTVEEDVGAMICTAADYTVSPAFVPYAPTNRELYETRFASKTILPNNVDLNNIKTGGIYNGVNSTGNSAVHMPVATGSFNFVLTVIEANEFIIQIFKQLNSAGDPNFYVRRFYIYNSDWDSWYQFTGTQV